MNKQRRKEIDKLRERIQVLGGQVADLRGDVESIRDEEQEVLDNMPENFQEGEWGEQVQAAIDALDEVASGLEEFDFEELDGKLEEAQA